MSYFLIDKNMKQIRMSKDNTNAKIFKAYKEWLLENTEVKPFMDRIEPVEVGNGVTLAGAIFLNDDWIIIVNSKYQYTDCKYDT